MTSGVAGVPYQTVVESAYNYYAFGMLLPEEYNPTTNYRFGFNGMLRDDDMKEKIGTSPIEGTGNSYSTEFRMYDPRIGRWWSLDPKPTASESWYVGMGNNPISRIDLFGDSAFVFNSNLIYQNTIDDGNKDWSVNVMHNDGKSISTQVFELNDQKGDPGRMKFLIKTYSDTKQFLFYKSEKDENQYMESVGLSKPKSGWSFATSSWDLFWNSHYDPKTLEGKYDLWGSRLVSEITKSKLELFKDQSAFFITGNKAYDDMDYGNRLWGKATGMMRLPLWYVKTAAHIVNFWDHPFTLDDPADQRALEDGWRTVK